jgi:hypothetical protein
MRLTGCSIKKRRKTKFKQPIRFGTNYLKWCYVNNKIYVLTKG